MVSPSPIPQPGGQKSGPPFVEGVRSDDQPLRYPRVERLLVAGWVLIVVKSIVVWWAREHYALPFHPMWVIAPTVGAAAICTVLYWRVRR